MNMHASDFESSASQSKVELSDDFQGATFLDRFRVATKLNFAVFGNTLVLALVALTILATTFSLGDMGKKQDWLVSVEARTNYSAIALADASDALDDAIASEVAADRASALAEANQRLKHADDMLLVPLSGDGEYVSDDVRATLTAFHERINALSADLAAAGGDRAAIAALDPQANKLYKDVSEFGASYHDEVVAAAEVLFDEIARSLVAFVLIVVIGVTVSLVGARKVVQNVAGMVTRITEAMGLIAAGHADTPIPGRDRQDEIGAMARALAVFRRSMLDLKGLDAVRADAAEQALALAQEREEMRSDKTRVLNTLADDFEESIGEVTGFVVAASEELRTTAESMAGMAVHASTDSKAAAEAMETSSQHVVSAAAASDEFALSISEISKQASSSADLARNVLNSVNGANERIVGLNKATEEISEIAELIQSIATRTNLLALNASIEAARGGEAGRGFAVVASEVKELAFKTSEATANVASRIAAIQAATGSSVEDLAGIAKEIAQLEQASTVIASAVDQQSTSGRELARNIDDVATTSREVAQTLEGVRDVSELTGKSAAEMVGSASEMQHQAQELRAKAQEFLVKVREANKVG